MWKIKCEEYSTGGSSCEFFPSTEVNHKVRPRAFETWIKRPCGLEQGLRIHVN